MKDAPRPQSEVSSWGGKGRADMGHSKSQHHTAGGYGVSRPWYPPVTALPWAPNGDAPSLRHPTAPDSPRGKSHGSDLPQRVPPKLCPHPSQEGTPRLCCAPGGSSRSDPVQSPPGSVAPQPLTYCCIVVEADVGAFPVAGPVHQLTLVRVSRGSFVGQGNDGDQCGRGTRHTSRSSRCPTATRQHPLPCPPPAPLSLCHLQGRHRATKGYP